ncbi:MAG: hypothetical protein KAS71_01325 [Bacteroidales bacterium]|nr:hypothetical protein [Bacteroidales bacterium]
MRLLKNLFYHNFFLLLITGFLSVGFYHCNAQNQDSPQWGEKYSRNMVSKETGLPSNFNPETGENIKWTD